MIDRTNTLLCNLSFDDLREYIPHSNEMLAIKAILYKLFTFLENKDATIKAGYINYARGYGRTNGKSCLSYVLDYSLDEDSLSNRLHADIIAESDSTYNLSLSLEGHSIMKILVDFLKEYYPEKLLKPTVYIEGILKGWDLSRTIIDLYVNVDDCKFKSGCDVLPLDIISHIIPRVAYTFLFPALCIYHSDYKIKTQEFNMDNLKIFNILIDMIINGMKQL